MSKEFQSFVFPETTKKQIDSMSSAEMKLRFYNFVTDYGMYGIEPTDLSEIDNLIWIPMKDLIDNCKKSRGGAPANNQNARKTTKTTENNQNNVVSSETTETTFNNDNGNHNNNLNDNDNGEGEVENIKEPPSPSPTMLSDMQNNYAQLVFDKFKSAGLPCQNGDLFKFMSYDFRLALEKIRGINSKDVLDAIDNYIAELKNPDSYIDKQFSFNAFVDSKTFVNCLPANYRPENFKKFVNRADEEARKRQQVIEKEQAYRNLLDSHPKECPDCRKMLIDVSGTKILWVCPDCRSEWHLKGGHWLRKYDEVEECG